MYTGPIGGPGGPIGRQVQFAGAGGQLLLIPSPAAPQRLTEGDHLGLYYLLTHLDARRSIRPWVVKSGRKWVQPRSNTDHSNTFPLGHPPTLSRQVRQLCCEETPRRELM
jgi:hypothetical protein